MKSDAAKKVLELMDSVEDGSDRFSEFLKTVSNETGVSIDQIKEDLKQFI